MIQAAPIETGGVSADFDPRTGIIRMAGTDFYDGATVDEPVAHMSAFLQSLRSAGVPIRIVSDFRETYVLSPAQLRNVASRWADVYRCGDRIALIVRSSLVKMQVSQLGALTARGAQIEFFMSFEAANRWLDFPAGAIT